VRVAVDARSRVGWVGVLVLAGAAILAWLGWLAIRTADSTSPSFGKVHVYGVVDTRLGRATMGCGGALTPSCRRDAGIFFDTCDDRYDAYFHVAKPDMTDRLVRELLDRTPPGGGKWIAAVCGYPD
jgi:hypothetical protein